MAKTLKIGNLWLNDVTQEDGSVKQVPSIKLGSKSKKPEYNFTVELVVKDNDGKIVKTLTDSEFINLYAPREGAPKNLKYELVVKK